VDQTQEANQELAAAVAEAIGGRPAARRFHRRDDAARFIDIATFADRPGPGVTSYATLGLSDRLVPSRVRPPLGVELVGVCRGPADDFASFLAALAFRAQAEDRWSRPGAIFEDLVPGGLSPVLRHAVLVPPYLWEALGSRVIGHRTVAWLLAVPITEAEREFARAHGTDELQARFEQAAVDITDPARSSVV
jgi:hypothetical protein